MSHYQSYVYLSQHNYDQQIYQNADMNDLATRLRSIREGAGLTQAQLAKKISVEKSQSLIANIESAANKTSTYLPEIAHALGISAYWLKTGKGSKTGGGRQLTDDETLLLQALPLISDDLRESWLNAARKAVDRSNETQAKAALSAADVN